jgi:hypothetical protein
VRKRGVDVFPVGSEGVSLGAETASVEHLAGIPANGDDHWVQPKTRNGNDPTGGPDPGSIRPWLRRLNRRLAEQERRLERTTDLPPVIDSGLDFVGLDLAEWYSFLWSAQARRTVLPRVLRSVRDYRRRLDRICSEYYE